jgi:hypothetical protein
MTDEQIQRIYVPDQRKNHETCKEISTVEARVDSLGGAFERIEGKVDRINDALQALIRIEERQAVMNSRLSDGSEKMDSHSARITKLEAEQNKQAGSNRVIVWMLGFAQTVGIALAGAAYNNSSSTQAVLSSLAITDARLDSRITNVEKK